MTGPLYAVQIAAGSANIGRVSDASYPTAAAHAAVSAAGGACTLTLAAVAAKKHKIGHVVVGYDAAPAAGATLTITDATVTIFKIPLTAAGPAPIPLHIESAAVNTAMVFTLSAGGGTILAYINIPDACTEA